VSDSQPKNTPEIYKQKEAKRSQWWMPQKNLNKSISKHSIRKAGANTKIKLRKKKNGFFNEQEQFSARRAEGKTFVSEAVEGLTLVEKCISSNPNTERGTFKEISHSKERVEIFKHNQKDKKIISKNKIENLRERSVEGGINTHHHFENPNLEIQIDSIVRSNKEIQREDKSHQQFKFKNYTPNSLEIGSEPKDVTNSEQKTQIKLSKQAQMIREKLNIPNPGSVNEEWSFKICQVDEDKRNFITEEFDQSRPLTTRINNEEEDQQLFMQYPNINSPKQFELNRMSIEAGLERISKEKLDPESDNDFDQEQYSMIIKNIEDEDGDYAFAAELSSSPDEPSVQEEQNNDDECMTVIEKD